MNSNPIGEFCSRNYLEKAFRCSQHQKNGTYGLGYQSILRGNKKNVLICVGVGSGKTKRQEIDLYVPHHTANIQALLG